MPRPHGPGIFFSPGSRARWRRVWDSNPRIHHCITRFRIERLKPSSANPPLLPLGGRKLTKKALRSSALWLFLISRIDSFSSSSNCTNFIPKSPNGFWPNNGSPFRFRARPGKAIFRATRDYSMPPPDSEKPSRSGLARFLNP